MSFHPSQETLLRAAIGDLEEAEAFELREHLIECSACAARFQTIMDEPDEPPASVPPITAEESHAAWQRLQASIAAEELVPKSSEADVPSADDQPGRVLPMPTRSGPRELFKVAALLVIGLGVGSQAPRLFGPESGPQIAAQGAVEENVVDSLSVRGRKGTAVRPMAGPAQSMVFWRFVLADPELEDQTLRIEVTGPDGTMIASEGFLRNGEIIIYRLRSITPSGTYNFRFSTVGEEPREVESFIQEVKWD